MENRVKTIMRASIIGIVTNVLLALFKILVGTFAHSISVMMDGVNNMADAGSSLITMVGTALASKQPDKKHPFGHGRLEYLSSLIIAGLILYAGITALIESIKGIIHPEPSDYSTVALVVITVAIVIKLVLALFTQAQGRRVNSDALIASGKDAIMDVVLSISTLAAAIFFLVTHISVESYLAAVISAIIIKAGVELLQDTISKILGEPAEVQLVIDIKNTIKEFPEVYGAYDLVLNNYGPDIYYASVHVEVDDTLSASQLDELSRQITELVHEKHQVILTAVGFYSHNTQDEAIRSLQGEVAKIAMEQPHINGIHGFYVNMTGKIIRFDLVVSFNAKDRRQAFEDALQAIRRAYPEYAISASLDTDFNELK